jgi:hypothetical protein
VISEPAYIRDLDDTQLLCLAKHARDDLAEAALISPESSWHEACFAAVLIFGFEMARRGIKAEAVH